MTLLPSQVRRLQARVELYIDGAWVDVSDRLDDQTVPIGRGRPDESGQSQAMSLSLELDNRDGALTPDNPLSPWYPNIKRGTPLRYSLQAGSPHLTMPGTDGAYASTPNHASLQVTTGLFIAFDVNLATGRRPPAPLVLPGAKWNATGNQRSWIPYLQDTSGLIRLKWSPDGTTELDAAPVLKPFPISMNGRLICAIHLDENDGAGGHTVTWYTGPSVDGPWAEHETRTFSGTTAIFASTAPLECGTFNVGTPSGSFDPFLGSVNALQVRSGGSAGTIGADVDFTAQTLGDTSFFDDAPTPKLWSTFADAAIDNWQIRFVGQVSEWSPIWPYGDLSNEATGYDGEARVAVTAAGITRRLSQGNKPLNSALFRTVMSRTNVPTRTAGFFPMEDAKDATSFASPLPDTPPMFFSGEIGLASDDTLASSKPLPTVSGGRPGRWTGQIVTAISATQWRIDQFWKIPTPHVAPDFLPLIDLRMTGTAVRWTIVINDADVTIDANAANLAALVGTTFPSDDRFFDTWFLLSINLEQDGANVDWTVNLVPIPLGSAFGTSGTFPGTVGKPTGISNDFDEAPPDGVSFGHIIVSTDAPLGWLAPADTAYVGEPASQRVRRLCEEELIPVTIDGPFGTNWALALAAGVQPMGPQRAEPFMSLLQDCADVDLGVLAEMRHAPGIAYRTGTTLQNQTPTLVLDAATNDISLPFTPTLDDQRLRNSVTAQRPGGSSATVVDQDSVDDEELYDEQVEVNVYTDDHLPDQASWRVNVGTWPGMRYPTVTSELMIAPQVIDDFLGLDLGDRIQVVNLPPQHPSATVDLLVQGYSEPVSPVLWTPTMNCSPAGPWAVGVFDTDRYDTAGSELAVAVDADDTSWSVATTEGPLWTVDNAEDGFDVVVGGEEVTVTDIATVPVTFGAAGTAAHANNANVTPGIPASVAVGNLLLVLAAIRNSGAGIPNTPSGYVRLAAFHVDSNVQLFAKIATSSESAPTISFSGGVANADTSAQMIRLGGQYYDVDNVLVESNSILNGSNQNIPYPPLNVRQDNCIVIYAGWKQDDWTSVATIAGATEIGEPDTVTGDDQGIVWDRVIQTTRANIAAGSFAVTGGVSAISRAAVIALRCDVQTFTAARSANGVEKAHAAGSSLRLAHPLRFAL